MTATVTTPVVVATASKKQLAGAIYLKMKEAGLQRKFIIDAMVAECHLTFSGASTYYQNFKSGQWDAHPKAVAEVKPDPKIGVDFDSMSDDELLMFFWEHTGVEISGFLNREDAMLAINGLI